MGCRPLVVTVGALLFGGRDARACDPGRPCVLTVAVHDVEDEDYATHRGALVVTAAGDPARSARAPALVGSVNCTWTTAMMAQRVLAEGVPWTFVGHLAPAKNELDSRVAAPYTVGPGGADAIYVVANEVLESLERQGATRQRLELHGRLLEVEGIRYFVIT